jgi:hypothetical protein
MERKAPESERRACWVQLSNSLRIPAKLQNFCSEFSGLLSANIVECLADDQLNLD